MEQVEFRPEPGLPGLPEAPAADGVPVPIPAVPPGQGGFPGAGRPPGAGRGGPPPGAEVIVMDNPRIVEEARAAAATQGLASADPQVGRMVEQQIERQLAAKQAGLARAAEALTREAVREDAGASALHDNRVEVAVQQEGRVIGRARARLNMNRTLRMVLGFARRDQGEISFAIDRAGRLHTQEAADRPRLQSLGVERTAPAAAGGTPRRVGDWIVVARRAPGASSSASPVRLGSRSATSAARRSGTSGSGCSSSRSPSSASSRSRIA